jgi:hypothetical protein
MKMSVLNMNPKCWKFVIFCQFLLKLESRAMLERQYHNTSQYYHNLDYCFLRTVITLMSYGCLDNSWEFSTVDLHLEETQKTSTLLSFVVLTRRWYKYTSVALPCTCDFLHVIIKICGTPILCLLTLFREPCHIAVLWDRNVDATLPTFNI